MPFTNSFRRRFRFWSLVTVALLICFYLGCWPLTQQSGTIDVLNLGSGAYAGTVTAVAPFVVCHDYRWHSLLDANGKRLAPGIPPTQWNRQRYYLWFFGRTRLLSERKVIEPAS